MSHSTIRETFGVIDQKTQELYPDILFYSISTEFFLAKDYFRKTIIKEGIEYQLQKDSKLKQSLRNLQMFGIGSGSKHVIISFQQRTTGNIALARLYQKSRENHSTLAEIVSLEITKELI